MSFTAPVGSPGMAAHAAAGVVRFKPFPWPALMLDIGAGTAGLAFILLLVFAFLSPTRLVRAGCLSVPAQAAPPEVEGGDACFASHLDRRQVHSCLGAARSVLRFVAVPWCQC